MSDSDGARLAISSRQLWVIFLVTFLAVGTVIGATSFLTNEVSVSNELTLGSSGSGLEVTVTGNYDVELSDDWAKSDSVILNTSEGNMSVSSSGASSATLAVEDINGTWTDVSTVDASAANMTFDPDDKNQIIVGGGITAVNFTDVKVDDDSRDLVYSASSSGTIVVETDGDSGTQYGLVDVDTNEGIDVATAKNDGTIHFTDVETAADREVEVRELGTLFIKEETPPHGKITSCSATVRFFEQEDDDPTIEEVTDGNGVGEISLTGLPVDEEFIASVKCGGYHNRTIVIDDLAQQETAYLINKSAAQTVEVTFQVNDDTGDFGDDSTLTVQKTINRSEFEGSPDGFSWSNVAGDQIGATNQFTVDLEKEDRYRLRIKNDDGDTRILGAHVAEATQTVTVTIQDVTIEVENLTADITVGFEKNESNNKLTFTYNDETDNTTNLDVTIYERGNKSANTLHDQTHAGPLGELVIDESLNSREMNQSFVVEFSGDRNDDTISGQYLTGDRGDVDITAIPDWVREFASVFAILLVPTVLGGQRAETAALVSTAIAAVLWWIRWLPAEVSILSIILAGTIAVGFKLRERGRGNIA